MILELQGLMIRGHTNLELPAHCLHLLYNICTKCLSNLIHYLLKKPNDKELIIS